MIEHLEMAVEYAKQGDYLMARRILKRLHEKCEEIGWKEARESLSALQLDAIHRICQSGIQSIGEDENEEY